MPPVGQPTKWYYVLPPMGSSLSLPTTFPAPDKPDPMSWGQPPIPPSHHHMYQSQANHHEPPPPMFHPMALPAGAESVVLQDRRPLVFRGAPYPPPPMAPQHSLAPYYARLRAGGTEGLTKRRPGELVRAEEFTSGVVRVVGGTHRDVRKHDNPHLPPSTTPQASPSMLSNSSAAPPVAAPHASIGNCTGKPAGILRLTRTLTCKPPVPVYPRVFKGTGSTKGLTGTDGSMTRHG
ncbi:hypothetical protein BDN67DRAFT_983342 [Paxillus ammoniavirescens]|nr:hypothetical protein BDN67DRAFT_983342 [Paxillus ammoniavirescens]